MIRQHPLPSSSTTVSLIKTSLISIEVVLVAIASSSVSSILWLSLRFSTQRVAMKRAPYALQMHYDVRLTFEKTFWLKSFTHPQIFQTFYLFSFNEATYFQYEELNTEKRQRTNQPSHFPLLATVHLPSSGRGITNITRLKYNSTWAWVTIMNLKRS